MFRWFAKSATQTEQQEEEEEEEEQEQEQGGDARQTTDVDKSSNNALSSSDDASIPAAVSNSSGRVMAVSAATKVSRPTGLSVSTDGRVESTGKRLPSVTAAGAAARKASTAAGFSHTPRSLTPTAATNAHAASAPAPHTTTVSAGIAPAMPAPLAMDLNDERWWRDALSAMQLDGASFLQPLVGAAPGVPGALAAPLGAPPSASGALPFDLSEEAYEHLAPRVLDAFPALALLRFKLVPARINEERFWRTLFYLIAQFHSANAATAAAAATVAPSSLPAATAAAAPARPLSTSMPKASRNGSVSPGSGRSTPLTSARASPSASPRTITEFPALPPLPLLHHHPPPPVQPAAGHVAYTPANGAHLASSNAQLAAAHTQLAAAQTQLAARDAQIRDLQAALASKDAALANHEATLQSNRDELASQAAHIDMLNQKLQGVTAQLRVIQSALQHSLQIVACPDMDGVVAAHAAATAAADVEQRDVATPIAPSPSAPALPASPASATLPPAPSPDGRLSTAPSTVHSAASTAVQPHSHGSPSNSTGARRFFECGRCHQSVPADAPGESACVSHSGGSWTLTKDSVEFFELPAELRQNLRSEKARRLAAVQKEMRFIIDLDDPTTAPGQWSCCQASEYTARGCKHSNKHTLQPSK